MAFKDISLTKKKALSLYKGTERERCIALASALGIAPQVVEGWKEKVPRWWAIIIVNLLHPERFK